MNNIIFPLVSVVLICLNGCSKYADKIYKYPEESASQITDASKDTQDAKLSKGVSASNVTQMVKETSVSEAENKTNKVYIELKKPIEAQASQLDQEALYQVNWRRMPDPKFNSNDLARISNLRPVFGLDVDRNGNTSAYVIKSTGNYEVDNKFISSIEAAKPYPRIENGEPIPFKSEIPFYLSE